MQTHRVAVLQLAAILAIEREDWNLLIAALQLVAKLPVVSLQ